MGCFVLVHSHHDTRIVTENLPTIWGVSSACLCAQYESIDDRTTIFLFLGKTNDAIGPNDFATIFLIHFQYGSKFSLWPMEPPRESWDLHGLSFSNPIKIIGIPLLMELFGRNLSSRYYSCLLILFFLRPE